MRKASPGDAAAAHADHGWERPWPMQAENSDAPVGVRHANHRLTALHLLAAICTEGRWYSPGCPAMEPPSRCISPSTTLQILMPMPDGPWPSPATTASARDCWSWTFTAARGGTPLPPRPYWSRTPSAPQNRCGLKAPTVSAPMPGITRPARGQVPESPLLVKSHSGPTAMARRGLNLGIQFWTSRGWGWWTSTMEAPAVLDGPTGNALITVGGWWMCRTAAAATTLVQAGKAHPERIAIEGGSAGGFTTLACLCFTDVFRVGACRYAVSDLSALATETHRFEARYLDTLVGRWPQEQSHYEERSPLQHADRIRCPVIFFKACKTRPLCRSRPNGWRLPQGKGHPSGRPDLRRRRPWLP